MASYTQKITGNTKTEINRQIDNRKSMSLTNISSSAAITIDLYLTSQINSKITDTDSDINLAAGYAITTLSQAIVIDNGGIAGTSDMFLNEKVYKSDGTFIGTCTTFGSATSLTFSGGLETTLVNNDDLYTGTRFYILNDVIIPVGTSLQLDSNDFNFNSSQYKMYIVSNNSDGNIDITVR